VGQLQDRAETGHACRRASDAEREQVAARVVQAMVDGRLSCNELEDRLAAAYGAKTLGELDPLTADLPFPSPGTSSTATVSRLGEDGRGVEPRPVNAMAVLSFVSAFAFFPLGPVFAAIARKQINRSGEEGMALAVAGVLISLVNLLSVIAVVVLIAGMPGHPLLPR
jgi:hypothetical protein